MKENKQHSNQQDSFDDIFKKKLENHELPVDDFCWNEIEKRLTKKNRIYSKIIWVSVAAASIALLFVFSPIFKINEQQSSFSEIIEDEIPLKESIIDKIDTTNQKSVLVFATSTQTLKYRKNILQNTENSSNNTEYISTDIAENLSIAENTLNTDAEEDICNNNREVDTILITDFDINDNAINRFSYTSYSSTEKELNSTIQLDGKRIKRSVLDKNWSIGTASNILAYNGNLPSFKDLDASDEMPNTPWDNDNGNMPSEGETEHPNRPNEPNQTPDKFDPNKMYLPNDSYAATHSPEISFGFVIQRRISNHFGIETGIMYTHLRSNFEYEDEFISFEAEQNLNYLGIPVNFIITPWIYKRWDLYFSVGGMLEKGINLSYNQKILTDEETYSNDFSENINGLQGSFRISFGANLKISKHINIYFSPQVAYYFDNKQPISIRTKNPLSFGLSGGVRYKF